MTATRDPDLPPAPASPPRRRRGLLRGQGKHILDAGYVSFFVYGASAQAVTDWTREAGEWIWLPAAVPMSFVLLGAAVKRRDEATG
ncbi:hypothetical protein ACFVV7_35565 [Streptomyces globisporus]|uniref:hypothetical protein n=1 Tax=Streptomyces globisporus TaxID=1908 RepID=UPI0036DF0DC1